MTNFIKMGLVVAVFFTTIFTYAMEGKGDYILNIKTGNGKVISITLNNLEKSVYSIFDENHNLVYTGESATDKLEISKTLSLEAFPAGTYTLEVNENGKVAKHDIAVSAKKSKTIKLDESVNESPSFRR
ncbi:secretion protein [Flavobacterium aquidurense]|uniref:secretion protein n=1 Tax=Flavobacterium aquidurense TaxID=362413 RepID=UPI00371DFA52